MGRVPQTVDIELFEDLVDTCSIGDTVTIVGLVKVINADQHKGAESKCSDVADRGLNLLHSFHLFCCRHVCALQTVSCVLRCRSRAIYAWFLQVGRNQASPRASS